MDNPYQTDESFGASVCAICLESILVSQPSCLLQCTHFYHSTCVQTWKIQMDQCPQCRAPIQCQHETHSSDVQDSIISLLKLTVTNLEIENQILSDRIRSQEEEDARTLAIQEIIMILIGR